MHHARRKAPVSPLFTVLFIVLLCIFPALALASASAPQAPPPAEDGLICHTSDPSECYPRVFHPTDEFQTVHDDQEIPKGLHVRMNMTSGKLEAKINVEGEVPSELEGVAADQSVLVVESGEQEEPKIPKDAPKYDPVGKIKEPENEAQYFYEALKIANLGADKLEGDIDEALEWLEDISHDIYYGLKITEDKPAVKSLLCLMVDSDSSTAEGVTPRGQQAAAILAGALSNNPAALKEVSKEWINMMESACGPGDSTPLHQRFYSSFVPRDVSAAAKGSAAKVKARVAAINGLIKDDAIRAEFLRNSGMSQLLEVLTLDGKEWTGAQRKVGQLALDNFLDEDMGAKTGQWPRAVKLSDKQCQADETRTDEGCWDFHVEKIMKANKGDKEHWSRDLHGRLAASRKSDGAPKHVEL